MKNRDPTWYGRMELANTTPQAVSLTQAVRGQAYPNRPGTDYEYESTEPACTLTVFGVPYVICPQSSFMHKWGLAPSPNCECGASEQTADHVLTACPIHWAPHGARGLTVLDDEQ